MVNTLIISAVLLVLVVYGVHRFLDYCEQFRSADWGIPFANRLAGFFCWFVYRYHRMTYTMLPLPDSGGAIVVSNHVSGLDPLLLIAASPRPLRFLIAREQYERFGLRWIFRLAGCIPVERDKRPELAMRAALRAINDGEVVALFPHGKIHLDSHPPIKIKGGAIRLAQITGSTIYPVRIEGVRGEGHTVLAVFMRSDADLVIHQALQCEPEHYHQNLQHLQLQLEARHFDQPGEQNNDRRKG